MTTDGQDACPHCKSDNISYDVDYDDSGKFGQWHCLICGCYFGKLDLLEEVHAPSLRRLKHERQLEVLKLEALELRPQKRGRRPLFSGGYLTGKPRSRKEAHLLARSKDKQARYVRRLISQGRCPRCGKRSFPYYLCSEHREKKKMMQRNRYRWLNHLTFKEVHEAARISS